MYLKVYILGMIIAYFLLILEKKLLGNKEFSFYKRNNDLESKWILIFFSWNGILFLIVYTLISYLIYKIKKKEK